jgi:hypothetical protein
MEVYIHSIGDWRPIILLQIYANTIHSIGLKY